MRTRERAPISIRLTPDEHERWREEARRRGTTLAAFVRDCVAAALQPRWQPGDPERRRDRRSLLTATSTEPGEDRWDDAADAPLSREIKNSFQNEALCHRAALNDSMPRPRSRPYR